MSLQPSSPDFEFRIDQGQPTLDLKAHFQISSQNPLVTRQTIPAVSIAGHQSNPAITIQQTPPPRTPTLAGNLWVTSIDTTQVSGAPTQNSMNIGHESGDRFIRMDSPHHFTKRQNSPVTVFEPPFQVDDFDETFGSPVQIHTNFQTLLHTVSGEAKPPFSIETDEKLPSNDRKPNESHEFVTARQRHAVDANSFPYPGKHKGSQFQRDQFEDPQFIAAAKFKSLETIKPAWSVDRFCWPSAVVELMSQCKGRFDLIGQSIISAVSTGQSVLAVTGLYRRQGQTTMSVCLANWAANNKLKCMLIDADMNEPGLASAASLLPPVNWRQVVRDEQFIEEALVRSVSENLDLMPQGDKLIMSTAPIDDWRILTQLIADFKPHYDLILVDLGPIREWIRSSVLRTIDAAISVHHAGIDETELHNSCQTLVNRGIPVVALVENRSNICSGMQ